MCVVFILGPTGAIFWSSLWWSHRDCKAAAKPDMCHVHQRQQSCQVTHPTLPELVSFSPTRAQLPWVGVLLLNVLCREVSIIKSSSCWIFGKSSKLPSCQAWCFPSFTLSCFKIEIIMLRGCFDEQLQAVVLMVGPALWSVNNDNAQVPFTLVEVFYNVY